MKIQIADKHLRIASYVLAGLVALAAAAWAGRSCGKPEPEVPTIVDASKVDANEAAKARAADQRAAQQIKQLESEHKEAIQDFDQAQKQEYERIKKRGPKEVARWLTSFNRELNP